ncbi:MAG: hypothetical protein KJ077_27310 [Anaerolineae bacterium]|nr:hypothetical protein [Anaerolineae bacterium]
MLAPTQSPLMTECRDDEEWRKRITAKLLSSPSHILIDNVNRQIDSGVLANALTSSLWDDRILGMSKNVALPIQNLWITTGNNILVNSEHARRAVLIRIDAQVEKPADREGFKHEDLLDWMKMNRSQIVTAILTLLSGWINEGRPSGDARMGSYMSYARVMSGILKTFEIAGFLANRYKLQERADTERANWLPFVQAWFKTYEFAPVSSKQLFPLASYYDDPSKAGAGQNLLGELIQGGSDQSRQTKLGMLLRKKCDKVFGGYRIIQHETLSSDTGKPQYQLASIEEIDF